jgi:succinyl-diaminopimelate desuccinylase
VIKESAPIHAAHPDPNGNMITMISEYLLDNNMVHEDDRKVLDFLKRISLDINGKEIDIYTEGEVLGLLVMCAIRVENMDGKPEVTITMRYPESITSEQIIERASAAAARNGFELTGYAEKDKPYILDPNTEIVRELVKVANGVTGSDRGPFIVGGGTYAHQLPNAYVFGSSSNRPPEDFTKGRGGAHGIDEAVSIECLQRAMKIYARALLKLNEMEW